MRHACIADEYWLRDLAHLPIRLLVHKARVDTFGINVTFVINNTISTSLLFSNGIRHREEWEHDASHLVLSSEVFRVIGPCSRRLSAAPIRDLDREVFVAGKSILDCGAHGGDTLSQGVLLLSLVAIVLPVQKEDRADRDEINQGVAYDIEHVDDEVVIADPVLELECFLAYDPVDEEGPPHHHDVAHGEDNKGALEEPTFVVEWHLVEDAGEGGTEEVVDHGEATCLHEEEDGKDQHRVLVLLNNEKVDGEAEEEDDPSRQGAIKDSLESLQLEVAFLAAAL